MYDLACSRDFGFALTFWICSPSLLDFRISTSAWTRTTLPAATSSCSPCSRALPHSSIPVFAEKRHSRRAPIFTFAEEDKPLHSIHQRIRAKRTDSKRKDRLQEPERIPRVRLPGLWRSPRVIAPPPLTSLKASPVTKHTQPLLLSPAPAVPATQASVYKIKVKNIISHHLITVCLLLGSFPSSHLCPPLTVYCGHDGPSGRFSPQT